MDNMNDEERPGNVENGEECPGGVPAGAPEPDLVFVSGRESMPMGDRMALLAAEAMQLEHGPLDPNYRRDSDVSFSVWYRTPDAAKCHAFNCLLGWARSMSKREPPPMRMSAVECCVLAWKRGGWDEHDRVCKEQRSRRGIRW